MKLISGHRLLISVWQMIMFGLLLLGLLWLKPDDPVKAKASHNFDIIAEKTVY